MKATVHNSKGINGDREVLHQMTHALREPTFAMRIVCSKASINTT
jgi:hypothetical protein